MKISYFKSPLGCNEIIKNGTGKTGFLLFSLLFLLSVTCCNSVVDGPGGSSNEYKIELTLGTKKIYLSLVSPYPGIIANPTLIVSRVKPGDSIWLHKDSDCSDPIGFAKVPAGQTSVDITIQWDKKLFDPGTYTFYVEIASNAGNKVCFPNSVHYELQDSDMSLDLLSPSPSINTTPIVRIESPHMKEGDYVWLYEDSSCLSIYGIGFAKVPAGQTSVGV